MTDESKDTKDVKDVKDTKDVKDSRPVSISNLVLEEWTDEIEGILLEWAEKALCYRWMHNESKRIFEELYNNYIIPIIIFSTVSGTINIGMKSVVPDSYLLYAQVGVGFVNIFTGLLSTLLNFFKYAEKKQSHESSAVLWHKFYRAVTTELALSPDKRRNVNDFFKIYRSEYDSIINQSLDLDEDIIYMFNKKFKKELRKGEICVPEIVSHIQRSKDYQEYVLERKNQKEKINKTYELKEDAKDVKDVKGTKDSTDKKQPESKTEASILENTIDLDESKSNMLSTPTPKRKSVVVDMVKLFENKLVGINQ